MPTTLSTPLRLPGLHDESTPASLTHTAQQPAASTTTGGVKGGAGTSPSTTNNYGGHPSGCNGSKLARQECQIKGRSDIREAERLSPPRFVIAWSWMRVGMHITYCAKLPANAGYAYVEHRDSTGLWQARVVKCVTSTGVRSSVPMPNVVRCTARECKRWVDERYAQ